MNDQMLGKRMVEEEHLALFLDAYCRATGETFPELYDSETPDFIGKDQSGRTVGIELTQLRFSPDQRHMRRIFQPAPFDSDAWWQLLELLHRKEQTLSRGLWPQCERRILVIMLIDTTIQGLAAGSETDRPEDGGFDEVWLVEHSQAEAFGAVDLFAVVHSELAGHLATGDQGQKPYG